MEFYEANRILRTVKAAFAADGYKLPQNAENDGIMLLLGKTDAAKYIAALKRPAAPLDTPAGKRAYYKLAFFRALVLARENFEPLSVALVMLMHKTLFSDCDVNAGKPRTADAATDGNAHTDPKYINGSLKSIISKMTELPSAPALSKEDFAGYLSHYMRELIILRPFECGSDLALRIFIMLFCTAKGFSLCLYRVTPAALREAEKAAFAADDITPLFKIFDTCLSYDHHADTASSPNTRREAAFDGRRAPPAASRRKSAVSDEMLRRAVKLRQKIARLNEQLTELMQNDRDGDGTDE